MQSDRATRHWRTSRTYGSAALCTCAARRSTLVGRVVRMCIRVGARACAVVDLMMTKACISNECVVATASALRELVTAPTM